MMNQWLKFDPLDVFSLLKRINCLGHEIGARNSKNLKKNELPQNHVKKRAIFNEYIE